MRVGSIFTDSFHSSFLAWLVETDFYRSDETSGFFEKTYAIILDAQYTLGESIEKFNWGHASYIMSEDFALEHKIRELYLFHHDPLYNNNKMVIDPRSSRWYSERANKKHPLFIDRAREDCEVIL